MPAGALKGTLSVAANSITNPTSATGSVAIVPGDLIYFVLGEQTSLTVTSVTDNLHTPTTYNATNSGTDAGAISGRAFWFVATVSGTLTSISATATASTDNVVAVAVVIAGPFLSSPLDANPADITTDLTSPFTCPSSGTLAQAPEVVIAWGIEDGNTAWLASSPNILGIQTTSQAVLAVSIGYQTVNSTSAVAPAFTAGSNPTTCLLGVSTFKLAPVGGWEMV